MLLIFQDFNHLLRMEFFQLLALRVCKKTSLPWKYQPKDLREPDFYRFSLKSAYGISDKLEFNLTVPYVYHYFDEKNGLEDIAAGFKYRFYDEGKYGPSMAFLLNASIPSGDDEISSDGRVGAGLIVSKRVGPFNGHLNFFYEKPGSASLKDEISLLGGVEFSAAHNFKILSEIIVKKSYYIT